MNLDELRKQRLEEQETFLKYFGGDLLQIQDLTLSLQGEVDKALSSVEKMERKKSDFSIPGLIYSIDQVIADCELLKNQLTELKYRTKIQHRYIYRDQDKE